MKRFGIAFDFMLVFLLLLAACMPGTPTGAPIGLPTSGTPSSPTTGPTQPAASPTPPGGQPTTQVGGGQPTPGPDVITIQVPQSGASVSSPVQVQGSITITPFESTLRGRVYDASGNVLGEAPIMVNAEMGQPGTFDGTIPFTVTMAGPGMVEVASLSSKDGSVVARAVVDVQLAQQPVERIITLTQPADDAAISSPVRVAGSVTVSPFESTLRGRVYDAAGNVVGEAPVMVAAEMGQPGNFDGTIPFTVSATGPGKVAVADISAKDGSVLASASVDVVLAGQAVARVITLAEPTAGATVASPAHVRGSVTVSPFESTLRGRVYDSAGKVVGEGPVMVAAEMGQPGEFGGTVPFTVAASGEGKVEVADISAKDGSVLASVSVDVLLTAQGTGSIEIPANGERVTLPLHILARVGQPGQQVTAKLTWQDGTVLSQTFTLLEGEDGGGLLIGSLNWPGESQPPEPPTQQATLQISAASPTVQQQQSFIVLNPNGADVTTIKLYFLAGDNLQVVEQRIPKVTAIGAAALDDVLWGPPAPNLAGFATAIPTPQQVLAYPGRQPDWGPRVRLLGLTIVNGVATANFSQEMEAYGGGSLRVKEIRDQITQTLKQFPTVQQVIIEVEGEAEQALQP